MKKFLSAAVLLSGMLLGAAEVIFDGSKVDAWEGKRVTSGNDGVLCAVAGYSAIRSKNFIPIQSGKKYVVSGEFRILDLPEGQKARLYFGFTPYNAGKKIISHLSVISPSPAIAELAADIKPGDTSFKLKNAADWKFKPVSRIVFNAKEDLSDLPNYDASPVLEYRKIKVNGDGTVEIPVKTPFTAAYSAGTPVRQHHAGISYVYAGIGRDTRGNWMSFSHSYTTFYPGTTQIKLAFNLDIPKCKIEMRNVKVTVE